MPLPEVVPAVVRTGWARVGLDPPADLMAFSAQPVSATGAPAVSITPGSSEASLFSAFSAHDVAHQLGVAYELELDSAARSAGAHYTPVDVAMALTRLVITGSTNGSVRRTAAANTSTAGASVSPPVSASVAPKSTPTVAPPTVWDPACGGGAFLLCAAEVLYEQGLAPADIVADLLWGTDIDPGAVAVTEAALVLWATLRGAPDARPGAHVTVADAVRGDPPAVGAGFAHVVANPPFQGQLAGGSVRSRTDRLALKERLGDVVGPYTDTSTLFLVAAIRALAPGGTLGMVLPTSVLSARDAQQARDHVDAIADLAALWVATEPIFDADVQVCAPVLVRHGGAERRDGASRGEGGGDIGTDRTGTDLTGTDLAGTDPTGFVPTGSVVAEADRPLVQRWRRRSFEPLPATAREGRRWSDLALAALDVPSPAFVSAGRLASVAQASSGFRDEYYGLAGHVFDLSDDDLSDGDADADAEVAGEGPRVPSGRVPSGLRPLVTSGTIDPGRCLWGTKPVRFAKHSYARPVVDEVALAAAGAALGGVTARAAAWAATTAGPKVVVATQTRVGEAAVDELGTWLPSTPTIVLRLASTPTAVPGANEVDQLWALAAVVCSPVGTVVALADSFGSARSTHAIKPSATSVLDLPLPVDRDAWSAGAAALRAHDRARFATAMAEAYAVAVDDAVDLAAWWDASARW